jgi:hypothetical protein
MATENKYTGNNSTTNYAFTFPYIKEADVKCSEDGVLTTAFSLANATTVAFDSAPGTGVSVRVFRETDVATASATYFPGSAIKSEDLNDNHLQVLYASEEAQERAITSTGGVINGDITLSEDSTLTFEGATDDAYETKVTVVDPTADRTITIPNVTGTIVTTGDTGTVTAAMLAADSVDSSELVDGSIDTAHIADNAITADKIASNSVTASELASNAVTNAKIADAAVDTAELATNAVTTAIITDANVTTAKIANDAVTNDKIGDAAVNRDQLASDSIITVKITDGNVTTAKIAADAITGAKIADDAINSEHYTDGSIDTAHIADANVTTAKIADDAVTTAKIPDSNITQGKLASPCVVANHINSNAVTTAKINNSAVTEAKIADDAVTAAKIADGAITSAHIAADTVVAADIAANAVGASELADNAVDTAAIATDAVTGAKIADDAIDSEHYTDGSIDLAHMSANSVDSDQYVDGSIDLAHMSANSVDSDQYVDGSIDEAHIANDAVSLAKLAGIARGKLIYGDASGNPAVLAVGSNGQVLKTDGTDVEWGDDVASGGAGTFTVADESSDTTCFPVFVTAATGTLGPKSDSQLTYNASSGALGATTFVGNVDAVDGDFDGTLEADAITVDGVALNEYIADTVGGMVSGNTETGLTVTYQDGDNTLDFAADAAQTGITSLLATDIKIGEDDQTKIDFETADEIHFYAANVEQVYLGDNLFGPESDSDVDLGSSSVRWKDAYVDSITVTGEVDGASLDISGNADIDGTLEADAITVDGTALNEYIADTVGAMVGSNTESGITVAYQDADNTLDFTVGTLNQNTTGSAATLTTGRTIGMTGDVVWTSASFNGSGNVTGAATIQSGAVEHAMLAGDAVDGDNLADNACDSEHYTDGSIDHVHLAGDCIDGDNIQDDVVNSEHIAAGAVDLEHMSSESVDEDNLHISNAGSNGQYLQKQSGNSGGLTWADVSSGGDGTPMFAVGDTDGTSIANTTYTALTWNTEFVDSDSAFASDAFTVPSGEGGNYWISFSISVDSVDDGDQWQGVIYKDTGSGYAAYIPSFVYNKSPSGGAELTASWSGIMALAVGDKIKVYGRHNQGGTQNIKTQSSVALTSFQGFKVS